MRIPQSNTAVHYRTRQGRDNTCHVIAWVDESLAPEGSGSIMSHKANREQDQMLTGKADQAVEIQAWYRMGKTVHY